MAVELPRTDVAVIGLGAVGGVAALPLTEAGLQVVGLEAGRWLSARAPAPGPGPPRGAPPAAPPPPAPPPAGPAPPPAPSVDLPPPSDPEERLAAVWPSLTRTLRTTGSRFKLGGLLNTASERGIDGSRIVVKIAHQSNVERLQSELAIPAVNRELKQAISKAMGGEYELAVELANGGGPAARRKNQSHLVRLAQSMGARLIETVEEGEHT